MPSVTYSGSFGGVGGYGGITAQLTATSAIKSVPSGAVITSISYSLKITADAYSSSREWTMQELAVGGTGGSPNAYASTGMTSREHVFGGEMVFSASDVSKFASDSIVVYADAYTTHSASSYLWNVSITVNYTFPEQNVSPHTVTVNGGTGTVYAPGETAVLAWSGAEAGANNAISGYYVSVYDSADGGANWQLTDEYYEIATTATSGSVTVKLPAAGTRRIFKVRTLSVYGTPYSSINGTDSPVVIRGHDALPGFTDTLIAYATPIKALHMQELQDRVATLRAFYGLSAYNFTTIVAGQTSLAGWTAHVLEIRAAIDEISTNHEAWLTIPKNSPRADVMQQLRNVVLSL